MQLFAEINNRTKKLAFYIYRNIYDFTVIKLELIICCRRSI